MHLDAASAIAAGRVVFSSRKNYSDDDVWAEWEAEAMSARIAWNAQARFIVGVWPLGPVGRIMGRQRLEVVMAEAKVVIHRDPEILGGTPVFVGTRVPVRILFEYLEAGDSLDVFLDEFPSVRREQAIAALELAREVVASDAHPA